MHNLMDKIYNSAILKAVSLCLVVGAFLAFTYANDDNYQLVSTVPVEGKFMTTDFLKNSYVITDRNQVMKYDSIGNLVGSFSESKFGIPTSVDATSPFNVLIFFKDFATAVTTDMRLNTRRLYKFSNIGIKNISAAALSNDNYIWIYDEDEHRLKKINHDYELVYQSLDIQQLVGEEVHPNFIIERTIAEGQLVFLGIPNMGIIVFDVFGNYYTSIPNFSLQAENLDSFQIINDKIVYFFDGRVMVYDFFTKEITALNIPNTVGSNAINIERGQLFLLGEKELKLYSRTL
ncbi:MAG: hypothetical protein R3E32_22510 [Chitinophagales bacterium]